MIRQELVRSVTSPLVDQTALVVPLQPTNGVNLQGPSQDQSMLNL